MHPSAEYQPTYDIRRRFVAVALAVGAVAGLSACESPERENKPSVSATPFDPETRPSDGATESPEVGETGTYEEFLAKINNASPNETGDVFVVDGNELSARTVSAFDSGMGMGISVGASFDPNTSVAYTPTDTEILVLNAYGEEIEEFANTADVFPENMPPEIRAGMAMRVGTHIYDNLVTFDRGDTGHENTIEILLVSANYAYRWEARNTNGENLFESFPERSELADIYYAARSEVFNLPDDPGEYGSEHVQAGGENAAQPDELGLNILEAAQTMPVDKSLAIPIQEDNYTCSDFLGARMMDMEGLECSDADAQLFAAMEQHISDVSAESGVNEATAALISFYWLRAAQNGSLATYEGDVLRTDILSATGFIVSEAEISSVVKALNITPAQLTSAQS